VKSAKPRNTSRLKVAEQKGVGKSVCQEKSFPGSYSTEASGCTACAKVFNKRMDLDKHRRQKHKSHTVPFVKRYFLLPWTFKLISRDMKRHRAETLVVNGAQTNMISTNVLKNTAGGYTAKNPHQGQGTTGKPHRGVKLLISTVVSF